MTILIYSESKQAFVLRENERSKGNSAYLRNPQYFNEYAFDGNVQKVYTDDPVIKRSYEAVGIEVAPITAPKSAPVAVEEEDETVAEAPKASRGKAKK